MKYFKIIFDYISILFNTNIELLLNRDFNDVINTYKFI